MEVVATLILLAAAYALRGDEVRRRQYEIEARSLQPALGPSCCEALFPIATQMHFLNFSAPSDERRRENGISIRILQKEGRLRGDGDGLGGSWVDPRPRRRGGTPKPGSWEDATRLIEGLRR
jgi:hypothetical protein